MNMVMDTRHRYSTDPSDEHGYEHQAPLQYGGSDEHGYGHQSLASNSVSGYVFARLVDSDFIDDSDSDVLDDNGNDFLDDIDSKFVDDADGTFSMTVTFSVALSDFLGDSDSDFLVGNDSDHLDDSDFCRLILRNKHAFHQLDYINLQQYTNKQTHLILYS